MTPREPSAIEKRAPHPCTHLRRQSPQPVGASLWATRQHAGSWRSSAVRTESVHRHVLWPAFGFPLEGARPAVYLIHGPRRPQSTVGSTVRMNLRGCLQYLGDCSRSYEKGVEESVCCRLCQPNSQHSNARECRGPTVAAQLRSRDLTDSQDQHNPGRACYQADGGMIWGSPAVAPGSVRLCSRLWVQSTLCRLRLGGKEELRALQVP